MAEEENFETKMKRLQGIVSKVENNALSLDESLPLFEEGTKLINELEAMLKTAEVKIATIVDKK